MAGNVLEDAVQAIKHLNSRSIGGILDLLGEGVSNTAGTEIAANDYTEAVKRVQEADLQTTVTVKLTQLGLAFDKGACIDHVRKLAVEAQAVGTTVEIDMEQAKYVDDTLDLYRLLRRDFPDTRVAIQAYLRRTPSDLESMRELRPKVRLIKGAYAEEHDIAFPRRKEIDAQYAALTEWLLDYGTDPAIATHDHRLIDHAVGSAIKRGIDKSSYEIQMLYGVRRDMQERLAENGHRVRVYVPYGSAWYPYLMRRIAERPATCDSSRGRCFGGSADDQA